MLNLVLNAGKIAVAFFWLAWILSLVSVIPGPYGPTIVMVGALVIAVHLFQYLLLKPRFAGREDVKISFVQTLLFGLAHWLPLINHSK